MATVSGRRHRGVVGGVGVDFVALEGSGGSIVLVALAGLGDVRPAEGGPRRRAAKIGATSGGDRPGRGALGVRLAEVLAQAVGQRPRILLHAGAASVVGDLVAVGHDVLTVRPDGTAGAVYVGLASVSEISFLASG
jgi:hypothetical protein